MSPINRWTRRKMLKASVAVPVVATASRGIAWSSQLLASLQNQAEDTPTHSQSTLREKLLLDFGWSFHFGHANDPSKDFGFGGSETGNFQKSGNFLPSCAFGYDDSDWTSLDLPHDWAVDLPFVNDPALMKKGYHPLGRNYPATSVGWYRRVFDLPQGDDGKNILLEFDGVYRETQVILNGYYIGKHSGGYDPFEFDVTDFVVVGGRNVLLIRVDATLSDGWFYEGAGIYRHVWLTKCNRTRVKRYGTFVRCEVKSDEATAFVRTEIVNQSNYGQEVVVRSTIRDSSGKTVRTATADALPIPESEERTFEQQIVVSRPDLWSLGSPILYTLLTEVRLGGVTVDEYETRFGIRSIHFDAKTGFYLNGKSVKVRGTCNHQDHAGLGAALPDAVQYYRIRKLKQLGSNAYRTSHNPPTPELINACDELGMLVLDETRAMSSNPDGITQFTDLVRRDRNHPSVFIWSMGNEEGQVTTEHGRSILTALKQVAKLQDGSRPVTIAPPPTRMSYLGGLKVLDVMGDNYADPDAEVFHSVHPEISVLGTEEVSAVGTRGIYLTDPMKGYVNSFDEHTDTGRSSAESWWSYSNARPWLAGGFIWTGFDYRGEPSPNSWPNISSQYGVMDTCGFPKDTYYYYQSWWESSPVLHLFPHWDWKGMEGKEIAVWVYSNLDSVELLLNGESLGTKEMTKDSHLAWLVPYRPGTLEARGVRDGKVVQVVKRQTTSAPARLVLKADRDEILADGEDVAFVSVELQDSSGRVVPLADNEITFSISGEGKIIGVGNGDPTCHESDKGSSRKAFGGLAMVIVQSTKSPGMISIRANSPDLMAAEISITAKTTQLRPQVMAWQRKVPVGAGVTGLWRPEGKPGSAPNRAPKANELDGIIFILVQDGAKLSGSVEGASGGMFQAPDVPESIERGIAYGSNISFTAGTSTYSGTFDGSLIQLQKKTPFPFALSQPKPRTGKEPAIGPPPDNLDPAAPPGLSPIMTSTLVLRRVSR